MVELVLFGGFNKNKIQKGAERSRVSLLKQTILLLQGRTSVRVSFTHSGIKPVKIDGMFGKDGC